MNVLSNYVSVPPIPEAGVHTTHRDLQRRHTNYEWIIPAVEDLYRDALQEPVQVKSVRRGDTSTGNLLHIEVRGRTYHMYYTVQYAKPCRDVVPMRWSRGGERRGPPSKTQFYKHVLAPQPLGDHYAAVYANEPDGRVYGCLVVDLPVVRAFKSQHGRKPLEQYRQSTRDGEYVEIRPHALQSLYQLNPPMVFACSFPIRHHPRSLLSYL